VFVKGSLTITASDGVETREDFGSEKYETSSYGDAVSNATAQAIRRTCSRWGLGRYLWQDDEHQPQSQPAQQYRSAPVPQRQYRQLPPAQSSEPVPGQITKEEWLRRQAEKQSAPV